METINDDLNEARGNISGENYKKRYLSSVGEKISDVISPEGYNIKDEIGEQLGIKLLFLTNKINTLYQINNISDEKERNDKIGKELKKLFTSRRCLGEIQYLSGSIKEQFMTILNGFLAYIFKEDKGIQIFRNIVDENYGLKKGNIYKQVLNILKNFSLD